MLKKIQRICSFVFFLFRISGTDKKKVIVFVMIALALSLLLGGGEIAIAYLLRCFLGALGLVTDKSSDVFTTIFANRISIILPVLIGMVVLKAILQIFFTQINSYVSEILNTKLKGIAFFYYIFQKNETPKSSGDLFFLFTDTIPKTVNFNSSLIVLIGQFLQAIVLLVMVFRFGWRETLVGILGMGGVALVSSFFSRKSKLVANHIPSESRSLSDRVEKSSKNILFFSIMRMREEELKKLNHYLVNLSSLVLRNSLVSSLASVTPQVLGVALVLVIASFSRVVFDTNPIVLVSFLYLFLRFTTVLSNSMQFFTALLSCLPQVSIIYDSYNIFSTGGKETFEHYIPRLSFFGSPTPEEYIGSKKNTCNTTGPASFSLKNVSFSFKNSKTIVFDSFNLEVAPGEILGIRGESGRGKSTLLMMMMGVIKPQSGTVHINDIEADTYFSNSENRIGYVGAEPYLVRGTLRENFEYGVQRIFSESELLQVVKIAKLDSLVRQVGLQYEIAEDHRGISAGQKQRICFARALLNLPNILVLDEATSNLDFQTERVLVESVACLKGKVTVIIVTHREGPLNICDNVITL